MSACSDCGVVLRGNFWKLWHSCAFCCENDDCTNVLCKNCHGKYPLAVVKHGDPVDIEHAILKKYCRSCFRQKSLLDFEHTYDFIQGESGTIFVFVHGGSGSRTMFLEHAKELKARYGHGYVLLDLPGHGSLVEKPLTPDSCAETLGKVLRECGIKADSSEKIIYVGGSLGAYLGFRLLDNFKDIFDAAVLMDCGQNVGPGASLKARAGLVFLSWCGRHWSNATLTNMMLSLAKKSPADYKLIETCFGAGMFFDQAHEQVECLRAVAPADYIPRLPFPLLFMNGSEDYRDSEDKWLELSTNKLSTLKVYVGGDHFFTHDTRFVDDILERFDDLSKKV